MADQFDRLKQALADRYSLEREIGRGGMATVYLAQDLKHRRKVAVKVLRPDLAATLAAERFLREIEIAAALAHPYILPVHDSGAVDGTLYYVMPYVDGESLRQWLNRETPIPLDDALQIACEIAGALAYAHRRGVIHRDIKPANILITEGHALVADFGIARAIRAAAPDRLTHAGLAMGTPAYMSPEQAFGDADVDGRSDIYSLGRVLYEMLTGELAASPTDRQGVAAGRLSNVPQSHRERLGELPPAVVQALARALAQDPEDRFQTADAFADCLRGLTPAASGRRRWPLIIAGVAAAALMAIALFRPQRSAPLDPNVLAVAPFDVLDPQLSLWREGMADMLSASLDGAGPLRTVPPSVVLRRWEGRADPANAAALGARVGAGLVLFGRLVGAGPDSARAVGVLFDAVRRRTVAEFDLRDRSDRVERLADSLAVRIMDELSRERGLSGWRLASLGSSSPAALKAFLQGEQYYRAFRLDSAQAHFERAIELDSTFALAYSRRAMAAGWSINADPDYAQSMLKAGSLNHGLARRESLLVAADSIRGAITQFVGDSTSWAMLRRLFSTLQLAAVQYPTDPQVWFDLGEARYHQGPYLGVTDREAYDAFARAVTLDSAFVPPYRHLLELALLLHGRAEGRRVAEQYVARSDSSVYRDAAQVTAALLDPQRAASSETQQALEALTPEGFFQVWYDVKWWADSAETSSRVARTWSERTQSDAARASLALSLAYRGHLREAAELSGDRQPALFVVLARLGAIPRHTMDSVAAGWLEQRSLAGIMHVQRWWAEQRDTNALRQALFYWDSVTATVPPATRPRGESLIRSSRAYLALARGDTAQALRLLEGIPNWPNRYFSYYEQLTRARVLSLKGRDREAAELLDHMPFERLWAPTADAVIVQLERGRVHERLGNRDVAVQAYSAVVNAWRNADPGLQPVVEEARAGLVRLAGEPSR